jgi:hypothetical protein
VTSPGIKKAAFEGVVIGLCQYEVAAILSRKKIPTLTRLSRKQKWLAPVLVAGLTVHLFRQSWNYTESGESA